MSQHEGVYDDAYYREHTPGSLRSARFFLQRLTRVYPVKSVIDFGCGNGAWLQAAETCGAEKLNGLDGSWVNEDRLLSEAINFSPTDLAADMEPPGVFDLAVCVEVAEHLPEERNASLIDTICNAAPVVIFGAAIPHQGGEGHGNERWQSDWVHQFQIHDYEAIDAFRGAAWHEPTVDWWYAQNTILFVRKETDEEIDRDGLRALATPIWNVAHPAAYEGIARKI